MVPIVDVKAPLRRSRSNRLLAGVVAGLANYVGMDATLARVIYVIGSILSAAFPGVLVYLILWVLIPEED
ncbi:MAG TPA: PspC domain-containing protein [Steroidobacteraceae bacterium]|nr:PspC domain-containing protein [Steroidobacteraceae bacterium]